MTRMTLYGIYKNEEISIRSYNVCKYSNLKSIEELINYYLRYDTFEKLHGCGRKTNEELIQICKKYQSDIDQKTGLHISSLPAIIPNLTKNQQETINSFILNNTENLSVRSKSAIFKYLEGNFQIENFQKKKLFSDKFNLFKIKNAGVKCVPELEAYILSIKEFTLDVNKLNTIKQKRIENKLNPFKEIIPNLTDTQREIINNFIYVSTKRLFVRNRNAILFFLNRDLSIVNFADKILLSKSFNISKIDKIGEKSIPEIKKYISSITDFLTEVSQLNDKSDLIPLKNTLLLQRTFPVSKIPNDILVSESIFQLTNFLIDSQAFFDEYRTTIIKKTLKIYQNNTVLTLDEIAAENNMSREQIKRVRKESLILFHKKLLFVKNIDDDLLQNYEINILTNQIEVTDEITRRINQTSKTNFSKQFVSFLLSVYLDDDFSLLGNIEDVLLPRVSNSRKRHNWNNLYLIRKDITYNLNFTLFANDIAKKINARIDKTYSLDFKSYLSEFTSNNENTILDLAFPIAEKIINKEFGLYLDSNNNIIFKRNTFKRTFEYVYEALECLKSPSKIDIILKKIQELYPDYKTDTNKIRAAMTKKDGFVSIGNSIFGLKKWENNTDYKIK